MYSVQAKYFSILLLGSTFSIIEANSDDGAIATFIDNQQKLVDYLFQKYDEKVTIVYPRKTMAASNTTFPPRFQINVTLHGMKLCEIVEPEEKITFLTEYYMLSKNGSIAFYNTVLISTVCSFNVSHFPFDEQRCTILLSSDSFEAEEYVINGRLYEGLQDPQQVHLLGTGEWKVKSLLAKTVYLEFGNESYETAYFETVIKRNPSYYIYIVVVPAFILNALSIIGIFMRNADEMTKLSIGLTNILTMSFLLGILADRIPKTATLPILGIYIIINLSIIVFAVIAELLLSHYKINKMKRKEYEASRYFILRLFCQFNFHLVVFIFSETANIASLIYLFSYV